jgi:hypothetical protein
MMNNLTYGNTYATGFGFNQNNDGLAAFSNNNIVFLSAKTNGNVGIGTVSPLQTATVKGSVGTLATYTITANYTVDTGVSGVPDYLILVNANNLVITLPTPSTNTGRHLRFVYISTGTAYITSYEGGGMPHILYPGGNSYYIILGIITSDYTTNWSELWCDGSKWIMIAQGY